ncbi:MAG: tetratricopeptide repeat protein [Phycisphaerae bacterium]
MSHEPLLSKRSAHRAIRESLEKGLEWIDAQEYPWFARTLLPAVHYTVDHAGSPTDRMLAAIGLALVGDVYDLFFDAPRAAIRAYRHSIRLYRDDPWPWCELGTMYDRIGDYNAARRSWLRAKKLDPTGEDALVDLHDVEHDLCRATPPLYHKDDPVWRAREQMARRQFRAALRTLARKRSVEARLCRARIHGALGNHSGCLNEWTAIGRARGAVSLQFPDWFFLTDEVWDHPDFWRAMLAIGKRLERGMYPRDESFPEQHVPPYDPLKPTKKVLCSFRRRWRLSARLHLARTTRNASGLQALCRQYPTWTAARRFLKALISDSSARQPT